MFPVCTVHISCIRRNIWSFHQYWYQYITWGPRQKIKASDPMQRGYVAGDDWWRRVGLEGDSSTPSLLHGETSWARDWGTPTESERRTNRVIIEFTNNKICIKKFKKVRGVRLGIGWTEEWAHWSVTGLDWTMWAWWVRGTTALSSKRVPPCYTEYTSSKY
jgi:hypothetical protein